MGAKNELQGGGRVAGRAVKRLEQESGSKMDRGGDGKPWSWEKSVHLVCFGDSINKAC